MTDEEWEGWVKANLVEDKSRRAILPCEDCIPAFALEMRAIDLCKTTDGVQGIPLGVDDSEDDFAPRPPTKAQLRKARYSRPAVKAFNKRPETRSHRSEVMRAMWKDPAYRKSMAAKRMAYEAEQREVVVARASELRAQGLSFGAIGKAMGVAPGTAHYYLHGRRSRAA